jgi:hypothetical protein
MFKKLVLLFVTIVFITSLYAASVFSECSAIPQTDRVVITWITKDESGLKHFAILRSNDDRNYIELKKVNPQGPGTRYEYVDDNVMFKDASVKFYKVRAVGNNGQVLDESSLIVHPNISGIFRTWGAIKNMFR